MRFSFETAIERLGRILARQYHINVVYEGDQARTDGNTIYLPQVKEMNDELWADLNGYLDHEVGHCKFTKFDEMTQAKTRMHREMLNMVEDVRIEREMIKEFPGCELNLTPLNTKLRAGLAEKWAELPWPVRVTIGVGDIMQGKAPRIDEDTQRYFDKITEHAKALNDCTNTTQLRERTAEIVKLIQEEREEEKKEEEQEQDADGGGSGDDSDKDGESEGGDKGDSKSEPSDGDSDSDSEPGDGSKSKPSKSKSKGGGKPSEPSDDAADEMLTEAADSDEPSQWDEHTTNVGDMVNEELKKHIDKEAKDAKPKPSRRETTPDTLSSTPHIPVTTRFDTVTDHSGKGDSAKYARLKREVLSLVGPIKQQLERILKVQENAKWRSERERGGLDPRSLSRLASNKGYRTVFREHTKTETNNVAVELLIDMSGSMNGTKIHNAKLTAVAMAEALKDLQIPFEVTGFYSEYDNRVINFARTQGDLGRYNRTTESLRLHVFKGFDASSLSGLEKLYVGSQNPDGECVAWAAKRLAERREKRKILIVLSDGMPATGDGDYGRLNSDLKTKVEKIQKSGIECIGVGIETESVKRFYKDYVVLGNVKDLPKSAMKKLSSLITKGARVR